MKKQISFGQQLDDARITSRSMIRAMLRQKKFVIINNTNGHDYDRYVNKKTGVLLLNNPEIRIGGDYRTVERGVYNPELGGMVGNNLSLYDIAEAENPLTKIEILGYIEDVQKKKRDLEEQEHKYNQYLEFMLDTDSDVMKESDFQAWQKDKVTKTLKETTTSIATVKV